MRYEVFKNKLLEMTDGLTGRAAHDQAKLFAIEMCELFGIGTGPTGRPSLVLPQQLPIDTFSLKGYATEMMGQAWFDSIAQYSNAPGDHNHQHWATAIEAGDAGILPANLPQTTAFLATTAGMMQTALLRGFEHPQFVIDSLSDVEPTNERQTTLLGISDIGDVAEIRNPGDPYKRAGLTDNKVVTPPTEQTALAIDVYFETIYFDRTRSVIRKAQGIGDALGLRKEKKGIRVILGIINPYNWNGVSYNTYQTAGALWTNKSTANPIADYTNVALVKAMASQLLDPNNSEYLNATDFNVVLATPYRGMLLEHILGPKAVGRDMERKSTPLGGSAGDIVTHGPNPVPGEGYRVLGLQRVEQVMKDTVANGGLAYTQTQANGKTIFMRAGSGHGLKRMENWPMRVRVAQANDYAMMQNGIMMSLFADQMFEFAIEDPRDFAWHE